MCQSNELCLNTDRGPDVVCPFCKVPLLASEATYTRLILECPECKAYSELITILTPVYKDRVRRMMNEINVRVPDPDRKEILAIFYEVY